MQNITYRLYTVYDIYKGFPGGTVVKNLPAITGDARDAVNPWVGKLPWSRKWHPTPVFLPGNSLGRGAWQATVHGATKRQTQLNDWAHDGYREHCNGLFIVEDRGWPSSEYRKEKGELYSQEAGLGVGLVDEKSLGVNIRGQGASGSPVSRLLNAGRGDHVSSEEW